MFDARNTFLTERQSGPREKSSFFEKNFGNHVFGFSFGLSLVNCGVVGTVMETNEQDWPVKSGTAESAGQRRWERTGKSTENNL